MEHRDAVAVLTAGLWPGRLTVQEHSLFGSTAKQYLAARSVILRKWTADPRRKLLLSDCMSSARPVTKQALSDAYRYLTQNAYVNWGCYEEPPEPQLPLEVQALLESSDASVEVVRANVHMLLTDADFQVRVQPRRRCAAARACARAKVCAWIA